jgi:N-acyl-D-aspartate/D-glutamate deacylase
MAERLAAGAVATDARVAAVLEGGIGAEMYVASDGGRDRHVGRSLAQVAETLGTTVAGAAHALLAEAGEDFYDVVVVERWAGDADVDRAVLDDAYCLMGDGVTGALDGPLAGLAFSLSDWGWVPRVLGHYVRDTGSLPLAAAVRRMTQAPAEQLGLRDRGVLRAGMAADVAVFDLGRVGTAVAPGRLVVRPSGVPHVLVGGRAVVRDGIPTAARPGAVGRRV